MFAHELPSTHLAMLSHIDGLHSERCITECQVLKTDLSDGHPFHGLQCALKNPLGHLLQTAIQCMQCKACANKWQSRGCQHLQLLVTVCSNSTTQRCAVFSTWSSSVAHIEQLVMGIKKIPYGAQPHCSTARSSTSPPLLNWRDNHTPHRTRKGYCSMWYGQIRPMVSAVRAT
jgi:hypothetical protein